MVQACSYKSKIEPNYYCQKLKYSCIESNKVVNFKTSKGDIQVKLLRTSRYHGEFDFKGGNFKYTDNSTNGSWVQQKDTTPVRIHRDSFLLQGEGWIALGQMDFTEQHKLLHYKVIK